jgi:hypothetical protein
VPLPPPACSPTWLLGFGTPAVKKKADAVQARAGLLAREAVTFGGPESVGAEALAARWMEIPMPIPIVSALGPLSWTIALGSAAVAHWRAGSPIVAVIGLALAAPLFGFGHAFITSPIAIAALLVATVVIERRRSPRHLPSGG